MLDQVPGTTQAEAMLLLTTIPYSQTRAETEKAKAKFQTWCKYNGFAKAADILNRDWERPVTPYSFTRERRVDSFLAPLRS